MFADLRDFLDFVEESGDLVRIKDELDPKYEISGILKGLGSKEGPVFIFENVIGYESQIAANIFGTRRRVAQILGVNEKRLIDEYLARRSENPIPPRLVKDSPVKEVVMKDRFSITKSFPILTHHEKDAGPYMTAGIVIFKDIVSGHRSIGIHRMQIKGADRIGVLLVSPTASKYYSNAERLSKPMDVAIAIGVDPITFLSSIIPSRDQDKFEIAGTLKGSPLDLVKCETVDIEIPANAEIAIEGRILPHLREKEGPFGESTGYYLTYENPVIEVTAITHRKGPIYHAHVPWTGEDDLIQTLAFGSEIGKGLKTMVPSIEELNFVPGTVASHVIFSIRKKDDVDVRRALILVLLFAPTLVKKAVVVDEDINVFDEREVEWAIATRFQADRDLIVLPNVPGLPIDPSAAGGVTAKMGMDATKPLGRGDRFEKIDIPAEVKRKCAEILKRFNL